MPPIELAVLGVPEDLTQHIRMFGLPARPVGVLIPAPDEVADAAGEPVGAGVPVAGGEPVADGDSGAAGDSEADGEPPAVAAGDPAGDGDSVRPGVGVGGRGVTDSTGPGVSSDSHA